ncbi:hypothetical protein DFH28DRAFT_880350 [Melampsora americana]|nr:hypothetical protein DFH28DRAFT_880350 [Melampsora americana]
MPDIPSHHFQSIPRRRSQVADFLHRTFRSPKVSQITVDFDLAVAYFLQHTHHLNLGDIPQSVEKVDADFSILPPLTGRQEALRQCTQHIKQTLARHAVHPGVQEPFALRYRNLDALNSLAVERTFSPTLERGRKAFEGAAKVHNLPIFEGPMSLETFARTSHPSSDLRSPFPVSATASSRLNGADSIEIQVPECINGVIATQAIGFGRLSVSVLFLTVKHGGHR